MGEVARDILEKIVAWARLKFRIQTLKSTVGYFKEREVWWAHLGENIGSEQNGKNEQFDRPVLVIKKFNERMLWILPLTSTSRVDRYNYVLASVSTSKSSKVALSQIRTISSKRLINKLLTVSEEDFSSIRARLRDMLA